VARSSWLSVEASPASPQCAIDRDRPGEQHRVDRPEHPHRCDWRVHRDARFHLLPRFQPLHTDRDRFRQQRAHGHNHCQRNERAPRHDLSDPPVLPSGSTLTFNASALPVNTTFVLRLKGPTAFPGQTFTTDSVGNYGPFTFALTGAASGVYTSSSTKSGRRRAPRRSRSR